MRVSGLNMEVTNIYKKTLNATDFGVPPTGTDVSMVTQTWTLLCEYKVPAQQYVRCGVTESAQGGLQGKQAYMRVDHTDGAQVTDLNIRVKTVNANDEGFMVCEFSATEWSASATDRNSALLLPEQGRFVGEDSKIQIWGYVTGASTKTFDVSDADSKIQLPVTIYTISR